MPYRVFADLVLVVHFAFVLFVVFGGLSVIWRPRAAWAHLPALFWGAAISFGGWVCPLTPLENRFRYLYGATGYDESFIEHYILAILYPEGLTRGSQILLGLLLLTFNIILYSFAYYRTAGRS